LGRKFLALMPARCEVGIERQQSTSRLSEVLLYLRIDL
jgi:hypothetical protein